MKVSRRALLALFGSIVAAAMSAVAFKPNETDHGHRLITEGVLFSGYAYGGKTVPVFTTTLSDGKSVQFSSLATSHVMLGNKSTDLPTADFELDGVEIDLKWELDNPVAHCDDELIEACSERIRILREDVVSRLKSHLASGSKLDLGYARGLLGKALHTLQDFYAHSNHADVHTGAETFDALTGNAKATAGTFARGPGVAVCDARAPTLAWVVAPTYANNGGNWKLVGSGLLGGKYTTGWFTLASAGGLDAATDTDGAKCDHGNEGGLAGTGFSVVSGISKDVPYAPLDNVSLSEKQSRGMPSTIHVRASHQAALHTRKFLESVIATIKVSDPSPDNQDKMIRALLGIDADTAVFGFVVDRTGSMGSIINGVKTQIQKLIDDSIAAGGDAATRKFMIVDYGDPDVSAPVIGSAEIVKAYLNTISASGGGDCPESTNSALKAAVAQAPKGSSLYVFTDASSNDASFASEVLSVGQSKNITISYAVSGSCSPIDASYFAIANGTGGQVIEVDHTSAGVAAAFTSISIDSTNTTSLPVVIESGSIANSKTVTFPVEDGATRLSIIANIDAGNIIFKTPSGISPTGTGVVTNDFIGGRGIKVSNPQAGIWSVTFTPNGPSAYSIKADIAGTLDFNGLNFMSRSLSGRTGHEGAVEFNAGPPQGNSRVELALKGALAVGELTLQAVATNGDVLTTTILSPRTPTLFVGETSLGSEPVRMSVHGKTPAGYEFRRVMPTLYSPRPFSMEIVDVSQWARGIEGELRVKLTNHGSADNFSLNASAATAGTVGEISPATFALTSNESATVSVHLAVDGAAPLDTRHKLEIVARNTAGTTERFSHNFALSPDTDGDGVPDVTERGLNGTDITYDGNGDGIPDWQQVAVTSLYSRMQRGYVTIAVAAPGRLSLVSSKAPSNAAPGRLPYDLFDFRITGISAAGTATMKLYLPAGVTAGGYLKYGPESANTTPHWYDFQWDGTTGAVIARNLITLTFVDGGRGDDDLTANGTIVDAGGPSGVAVDGVSHPQDPVQPSDTEGSSGGGCTTGDPRRPDATLAILFVVASVLLGYRLLSRERDR